MYSKPAAHRGQIKVYRAQSTLSLTLLHLIRTSPKLPSKLPSMYSSVFAICHFGWGHSSSNKATVSTQMHRWAEAAGVLLFSHTWTFMYESTLMRKPLYSMPHLSFTAIILPVRPARNGFGFTIPWHTTHNASKGELCMPACRACHPMHQLTDDMVCYCDCETKLNWLWVAPFNC